MNQERLLIVGGGFIGQSIKARCPDAILISNSSKNANTPYPQTGEDWVQLLQHYEPKSIIACFGTASVQGVFEKIAYSFNDQISKSLLLLNALTRLKSPCPKILIVGSAAEYGCITDRPIQETDAPEDLNLYGALKFSVGNLFQCYYQQYDLPIIYVRQFNTSGPLQRREFVIPSLVHQYLDFLEGKITLMKVGDLQVCRDFIHIDDTLSAYDCLLDKGKYGEIYNVSSNQGYYVSEILKYLESRFGKKAMIQVDEHLQRKENIKKNSIIGQNEKLRALGWQPQKTLKNIIEEIIEGPRWI